MKELDIRGASERDVLKSALAGIDPHGNRFEEMLEWTTTDSEAVIAKIAMDISSDEDYSATEHNCLSILYDGLDEIEKAHSNEIYPTQAYEMDVVTPGVSRATPLLKSLQKEIAE